MWVYRKLGREKFAVGFFNPDHGARGATGLQWTTVREFTTEIEAAHYVHYLNGGGAVDVGILLAERQTP